jgi:hypothetical protein
MMSVLGHIGFPHGEWSRPRQTHGEVRCNIAPARSRTTLPVETSPPQTALVVQ